jgi:hypothetical protein
VPKHVHQICCQSSSVMLPHCQATTPPVLAANRRLCSPSHISRQIHTRNPPSNVGAAAINTTLQHHSMAWHASNQPAKTAAACSATTSTAPAPSPVLIAPGIADNQTCLSHSNLQSCTATPPPAAAAAAAAAGQQRAPASILPHVCDDSCTLNNPKGCCSYPATALLTPKRL